MKKLVRYIPFHLLLCLIAGILVEFYIGLWNYESYVFFVIQAIFFIGLISTHHLKKQTPFKILVYLVFLLIGIFTTYHSNPTHKKDYYLNFYEKDTVVVLKIFKKIKSNTLSSRYEASVERVGDNLTSGKVILSIQKDSLSDLPKINDLIVTKSLLQEVKSSLNPNQFDYKYYLNKKGIYHQLYLKSNNYKILEGSSNSLQSLALSIREKIQKRLFEEKFLKDELAIINAILLGDRQHISQELTETYINAGAIHILAISGLHIGILYMLLLFFTKPLCYLNKGKLIQTVLVIVILWMFAFLTGLATSVVRSVTMFSFVAFGELLKRENASEHSLISSVFFLLLIHPMFLFDVGFQLSYLAVFSIIYLQPIFFHVVLTPKNYFLRKGLELTSVSLAAQVGVLPLSLYYFHQFPSLFWLSNLLIVPFLGTILTFGFIIIILSLINYLPTLFVSLYSFIIKLMNFIVSWIGNQEIFVLKQISVSFLGMIGWYLCIISLYQFFKDKKAKWIIYFLSSILFIQIVSFKDTYENQETKEFIVFHKNRKSLVGIRENDSLKIIRKSDEKETIQKDKMLLNFMNGKAKSLVVESKDYSVLNIETKTVLFIDSLGVYPKKKFKETIVVLQHSPKINLSRLLEEVSPDQVIADGSNYKSYVKQWGETCKKEKTPFHYTGENGAYIMKY